MMQAALLKYIQSEKLFEPKDRLLCAVSGGIDSMVMLHLLHKAGFELAVAHCNFGLRAEASDGDETFVKKITQQLGINSFTIKFETQQFAQNHQVSTQMVARTLRYDWFEKLLADHQFDYLLTAHHLNDVLETLLLNLTKGTGLAGLHGIKSKNGQIRRPMLFAMREQIESYAKEHQIEWREDSSNASNKYQRNLIRNQVVPLLKQINPNLEQTIQSNVERFASAESVFNTQLEAFKATFIQEKTGNISIPLPIDEIALLHEALKDFGFNFQQSKAIFIAQNGLVGKQFFSATHTLTIDRKYLIISILERNQSINITLNESILVDGFSQKIGDFNLKFSAGHTENQRDSSMALIDASKLIWPITLRTWATGDVFCPLGMGGKKKKVSDFLIDLKTPRNLKNQVLVLENADKAIIWVIGLRLDERFKVLESTEQTMRVEMMM